MKTIILSCALALFVGCANAEPPAHKQYALYVTVPEGVPITAVDFYRANHSDGNWTAFARVVTTNGATVNIPLDTAPADLYTADTTNSLTGAASDYAQPWTNNLPAVPAIAAH